MPAGLKRPRNACRSLLVIRGGAMEAWILGRAVLMTWYSANASKPNWKASSSGRMLDESAEACPTSTPTTQIRPITAASRTSSVAPPKRLAKSSKAWFRAFTASAWTNDDGEAPLLLAKVNSSVGRESFRSRSFRGIIRRGAATGTGVLKDDETERRERRCSVGVWVVRAWWEAGDAAAVKPWTDEGVARLNPSSANNFMVFCLCVLLILWILTTLLFLLL